MKSFGLYINSHCVTMMQGFLYGPLYPIPLWPKEWIDISMDYRDRWEYHQLSFGSRHFGESIDSGSPGRLSQSTEAGAGKRRIFAIGNFVNQRVLKPLHDFLMDTLRSIPMDGTFHQLRPDRWKGFSKVYSFDLKSATDRWPLSLQTNLIRTLFGKSVGDCLDAIFSRSIFEVPFFAQFEVSYSLE